MLKAELYLSFTWKQQVNQTEPFIIDVPANCPVGEEQIFEFSIMIPEDFAPAMNFVLGNDKWWNQICVRHYIEALDHSLQLPSTQISIVPHKYAARPTTCSILKQVHVGFMGSDVKLTSFKITHKLHFVFNEVLKMDVECNNTNSPKELKSLEFYLLMGFRKSTEDGAPTYTFITQVHSHTWSKPALSVPANANKTFQMMTALPEMINFCKPKEVALYDGLGQNVDVVGIEGCDMELKNMPASHKGRLFEVFYYAKIKVTHVNTFLSGSSSMYSERIPIVFRQGDPVAVSVT